MYIYIHTYIHTCMHASMHTCIHAYMHTCIHAYMHTSIHPSIHTYIHICMSILCKFTHARKCRYGIAPLGTIRSPVLGVLQGSKGSFGCAACARSYEICTAARLGRCTWRRSKHRPLLCQKLF